MFGIKRVWSPTPAGAVPPLTPMQKEFAERMGDIKKRTNAMIGSHHCQVHTHNQRGCITCQHQGPCTVYTKELLGLAEEFKRLGLV